MDEASTDNRVICILGATASGKSELAEHIAEHLGGEIVSADSMQVYRGMDIGTAKVPPGKRGVPYHCIDIVDPDEEFSAALYQNVAREAIDGIFSRGKMPIVCGGTGLYIQAALDSMEFPAGSQKENSVRETYTALAERIGPEALWTLLDERDHESAIRIHPHNVRRVIRAFEMAESGISYAQQNDGFAQLHAYYPTCSIGLNVPPEILYGRIDARVDRMVSEGLIDEIRSLMAHGFDEAICSPQAIGYKEFAPLLKSDVEEGSPEFSHAVEYAKDQVKMATHHYAKRQRSWFRRDSRIHWVSSDGTLTPELIQSVYDLLHL